MPGDWLRRALEPGRSKAPGPAPADLTGPVAGPLEALSREVTIPAGGGNPRVFDLRTLDQFTSWTLDYFVTGAPLEILIHQSYQHGEKPVRITVGADSGDRAVFAGSAVVEVAALSAAVDAIFRATVLVGGGPAVPIMPPWDQSIVLSPAAGPTPGPWTAFPFVGPAVTDGGFCPTDRHQLSLRCPTPATPIDWRFIDTAGAVVDAGFAGQIELYHFGRFQLQVRHPGSVAGNLRATGVWRRGDR